MGTGQTKGSVQVDLPEWLPSEAQHYLRHTEGGLSIRAVARDEGCHASTILRQIRRFEQRRDDPLVDEALSTLGAAHFSSDTGTPEAKEHTGMTAQYPIGKQICDDETVAKEARRILRRLSESGALLAVAPEMEKALVLRETSDGRTQRTAIVAREVAQAFAIKDWISLKRSGKVATYAISTAGRAALKRLLEDDRKAQPGFADAQTPFGAQHREFGERMVQGEDGEKPRRQRYNMAESPVVALARRRERNGDPFLASELVNAAERLREDFELAQMGPRVTQNWENFLTSGVRGSFGESGVSRGPEAARDRVAAALKDLGPGLGDMVLRCCCFLEGLEATEKRMGWSARSGKIVLRIALQRLKRHYEDTFGPGGGMIG
jgi:transposase-like protein